MRPFVIVAGALAFAPATARAGLATQDSSAFVVRIGRDTLGLERMIRTANQLRGEYVVRAPWPVHALYTADLKGPQATLKLTCQESHNYGEISTFKKALPYRPGDILLFNYAVIAHVGGSSEALWPVLDQIEALLRKKMRMAAAKLEDLPLSFGSGRSGFSSGGGGGGSSGGGGGGGGGGTF